MVEGVFDYPASGGPWLLIEKCMGQSTFDAGDLRGRGLMQPAHVV